MKPDLTETDFLVLGIIKQHSTHNRILAKDIIKETSQTYKQLKISVKRLRKNGIPIGASKANPMGYWIARTKEEIAESNLLYEAQAYSMLDTVKTMNKAHLNTWEYDLNDPNWRERNIGQLKVENGGKQFKVTAKLLGEDTTAGEITLPKELIESLPKNTRRVFLIKKND